MEIPKKCPSCGLPVDEDDDVRISLRDRGIDTILYCPHCGMETLVWHDSEEELAALYGDIKDD